MARFRFTTGISFTGFDYIPMPRKVAKIISSLLFELPKVNCVFLPIHVPYIIAQTLFYPKF